MAAHSCNYVCSQMYFEQLRKGNTPLKWSNKNVILSYKIIDCRDGNSNFLTCQRIQSNKLLIEK